MVHSFAHMLETACPECGQAFQAEVWLIVKAAGRPDLLERIRAGELHTIRCPQCGHMSQVGAPLLILRPAQEPPDSNRPSTDSAQATA